MHARPGTAAAHSDTTGGMTTLQGCELPSIMFRDGQTTAQSEELRMRARSKASFVS
jgi:hypothetical protein